MNIHKIFRKRPAGPVKVTTGYMQKQIKCFRGRYAGKQFVHFLHIGKTGGTAIKYALQSWDEHNSRYLLFFHPHRVVLEDIPAGEKVFFCLRNPASRFVSGFLSRQRQGYPRYSNAWNRDEKTAFHRFKTPDDLASALSSPNEREAAVHAMKSIAHVNKSFWYWFKNEQYFRSRTNDIIFIGFQERLSEDFETLRSILGFPGNIQLPGNQNLAHKSSKSDKSLLSDVAIRNLKKWYRADYQFIGLCQSLVLDCPAGRTGPGYSR